MRHRLPGVALFAATALNVGCFTLGNSVPDAIPVRRLPDEVLHNCPTCLTPTPVPVGRGPGEITTTKFQVKPGSEAPPVVNAVPQSALSCGVNGCGTGAVFYTGGGLGSGEYPLTRDLRVTDAIAVVHGALRPVMGLPSPGRVIVVRRLSTGQQLAIRVDLAEALRDQRENIPIWPGDMILTRETACEGAARVLGQWFHLAPEAATCSLTGCTLP